MKDDELEQLRVQATESPSFSYCHYIKDHRGQYVYIPACVGGASGGPKFCTCRSNLARLTMAEKRYEALTEITNALAWKIGEMMGEGETVGTIMAAYSDSKLRMREQAKWANAAPANAGEERR